MFYQLYKYLFLYAYQQPSTTDTGGLFYPKAIQHVFVGLYVQQVCLCGLFFLARNDKGKPSSIPEGALMVVLIVITAGFQIIINNSYGPLQSALPLSLQDKTYTAAEVDPEGTDKDHANGIAAGKKKPLPSAPPTAGRDGESLNDSHEEDAKKAPPPPDAADEMAMDEEESYGFAHPAASRPQRTVWIPRDTLGLSAEEERACREAGIRVSDTHAEMNEKGKVDVVGGPPDMIR